jgi:hypothetical protein
MRSLKGRLAPGFEEVVAGVTGELPLPPGPGLGVELSSDVLTRESGSEPHIEEIARRFALANFMLASRG